jgi:hypothetical protein
VWNQRASGGLFVKDAADGQKTTAPRDLLVFRLAHLTPLTPDSCVNCQAVQPHRLSVVLCRIAIIVIIPHERQRQTLSGGGGGGGAAAWKSSSGGGVGGRGGGGGGGGGVAGLACKTIDPCCGRMLRLCRGGEVGTRAEYVWVSVFMTRDAPRFMLQHLPLNAPCCSQ